MKYDEFIKLPEPPYPLPAPRYQEYFHTRENRYLERILLGGMTDECILIRARLYQLFKSSQKSRTASALVHDLDLFSLGAVRLARSLQTRYELHFRKRKDPRDRVKLSPESKNDDAQAVSSEEPIRSSENADSHFFIKKPFALSDLMRDRLEPFLFSEKDLFPGPGRPTLNLYEVLEGILYKLLANISWSALPDCYPSYSTCYRYYKLWKSERRFTLIMLAILVIQIDVEYNDLKAAEALFSQWLFGSKKRMLDETNWSHPSSDTETPDTETLDTETLDT